MSYKSYRPVIDEDLGLKRLYRAPIDKLPTSEQVQSYNQRNLLDSKLFRIGNAIWGAQSRTRIVNASFDDKSNQQSTNEISCEIEYDQPRRCNPNIERSAPCTAKKLTTHIPRYKEWLRNRTDINTNLNHMNLSEHWLLSKKRTELETRVLQRTRNNDFSIKEPFLALSEKASTTASLPDDLESDAIFSILQRIASYLRQAKLRPLDLFTSVDKDKNWQISPDEMKNVIKKHKIPMRNEEVNSLLKALDVNGDGEIDYGEFIKGLKQFQNEAREKSRSATASLPSRLSEEGDRTLVEIPEPSNLDMSLKPPISSDRATSIILEANQAEKDTKAASFSIELGEKQSKETRSKMEAKLNVTEEERYHKDLYQKATRTTITGEVKNAIYLKKKQLLEEYNKAVELCRQGNVAFTEELLRRALLEPFDKSVSSCKEDMRQSGTDLISYDQLMGIKKKTKKVTRPKFTGIERIYPPRRYVAPGRVLMKLSTGMATIQCKTDCWMTFEEFQNIIKDTPSSKFIVNAPNSNPFWYGQIAYRLRLYLEEKGAAKSSNNGLFTIVNKDAIVMPRIDSERFNPWQTKQRRNRISNYSYLQCGGLEIKKSYVL